MEYNKFKKSIEDFFSNQYKYELLEIHYLGYSFGHTILVYRIKGRNIKFQYDGREGFLDIFISKHHEKYPKCKWDKLESIYGINNLNKLLEDLKNNLE